MDAVNLRCCDLRLWPFAADLRAIETQLAEGKWQRSCGCRNGTYTEWFPSRSPAVLTAAVLIEAHPRSAISATFQVVNDDGSLLAALICCASLCFVDAAIPRKEGSEGMPPQIPCTVYQTNPCAVRGTLAAASCGLNRSVVMVDLSGSDERVADAVCTVAVLRAFRGDDDEASAISVPLLGLRGAVDAAGITALRSCGVEAGLMMQRILSSAVDAKLDRLQF